MVMSGPIIKGPKAFYSGLIFIALALTFGWGALSLNMGTPARMGPGFFPLSMCILLALFGIATSIDGLVRKGDGPSGTSFRAIVFVLSAVVIFALTVRTLGLIPCIALTAFCFSLSDREFKLVPALIAAAILSGASWVIFVFALKLPWQAFGTVFS